jgi:hypothetical protein
MNSSSFVNIEIFKQTIDSAVPLGINFSNCYSIKISPLVEAVDGQKQG